MTKLQMPSDSEVYFYFRTGDYPISHSHDGYWEFIYVTSGEYTHEINGKLRIIKAGTLCVLRPDDAHCTRENTKRSTYITFCVKDEYFLMLFNLLAADSLSDLLSLDYIEICLSQTDEKYIKSILDHYLVSADDGTYTATCDMFLLAFVNEIILSLDNKQRKTTYSAGVSSFIALLEKPENLALHLDDLIAKTNYSYSHLNAVFKKETGVTPSSYLKEKRLAYAKRLLVGTTYSHESIAASIGFATHSRFCVFFKEKTGLTPSQYAARYRVSVF